MDSKLQMKLVKSLVSPETFKGNREAYGREQKMFKALFSLYPDVRFWEQLNYPRYFISLSFFMNGEGASDLQTKWRYYLLEKVQDDEQAEKTLDMALNTLSMGEESETQVQTRILPELPKKQTVLDWADS